MDEVALKRRFDLLSPTLDERTRRLFAAAEALAIGRGGPALVARATGVSRRAIARGCQELLRPDLGATGRVRRAGAGRKRAVAKDPTLRPDLERLVEPVTRGDPESPLRWTCKSLRVLANELQHLGHQISYRVVGDVLRELGYSLQANRKTLEGTSHPDRDAQFHHLYDQVKAHQAHGQPVISVDTKKKELIGEFKNGGREWRPQGDPERVRVHDFAVPELGKVNPYGVYDLTQNAGWVSVGIDHDTAAFAVGSIRRWWHSMGQPLYPAARRLLITADGGGSNGYRLRLWKLELQKLADELGLSIMVCHLPPGTSKWNQIEHRLFSFITQNWRGKPLISHEAIVSLIAATKTATGLRVRCELDTGRYPKGVRVTDDELASVNLHRDDFHGEWNYTIAPRRQNEPIIS